MKEVPVSQQSMYEGITRKLPALSVNCGLVVHFCTKKKCDVKTTNKYYLSKNFVVKFINTMVSEYAYKR